MWNEKKGRPTPSALRHRLAAGGSEGRLCKAPGSQTSSISGLGRLALGAGSQRRSRPHQPAVEDSSHSGTCLRADSPTQLILLLPILFTAEALHLKGQGPAPVETAPCVNAN